jgi:hypothetical protein
MPTSVDLTSLGLVDKGTSEIQTGNPNIEHDPFDKMRVDPAAYRIIPLIYSAGKDGNYGLARDRTPNANGNVYSWRNAQGTPYDLNYAIVRGWPNNLDNDGIAAKGAHLNNIDNHHLSAR